MKRPGYPFQLGPDSGQSIEFKQRLSGQLESRSSNAVLVYDETIRTQYTRRRDCGSEKFARSVNWA